MSSLRPALMKYEVCILAGGLSTRMGRDKAKLRLGGRTMLSIIRGTARELGFPIRIVRQDLVPRCGPLGGVFTGLKTTRSNAVLFLACDMPFISTALLDKIVRASDNGSTAAFAAQLDQVGFPFLLPLSTIATVETQIEGRIFSIHELAAVLCATLVRVPAAGRQLFNVNTANDAAGAARLHLRTGRKQDASLVTRRIRPYDSRHAEQADSPVTRKSSRRQRQR